VRSAYEREKVLEAVRRAFGDEVFDENGSLNRKKLGAKAFASPENTEKLNKTVLPFIIDMINQDIDECGKEKILLDAPTLYESGADKICNAVCVILSDEQNRFVRITARDGIDEAAARLRMSAGKTDEYYKARTGHIIYNDAGEEALKEEFARLLKELGGN
jgi:dephospho-CoA kinase